MRFVDFLPLVVGFLNGEQYLTFQTVARVRDLLLHISRSFEAPNMVRINFHLEHPQFTTDTKVVSIMCCYLSV